MNDKTNHLIILGEIKTTGYGMRNSVYDSHGLAPTLMSVDYKDPWKTIIIKKIDEKD